MQVWRQPSHSHRLLGELPCSRELGVERITFLPKSLDQLASRRGSRCPGNLRHLRLEPRNFLEAHLVPRRIADHRVEPAGRRRRVGVRPHAGKRDLLMEEVDGGRHRRRLGELVKRWILVAHPVRYSGERIVPIANPTLKKFLQRNGPARQFESLILQPPT